MGQSPSWEANSHSDNQIFRPLENPRFITVFIRANPDIIWAVKPRRWTSHVAQLRMLRKTQFVSENLKENDQFGDQGVNWKLTFKLMYNNKQFVSVWVCGVYSNDTGQGPMARILVNAIMKLGAPQKAGKSSPVELGLLNVS
jgi:hypothetical protein